MRKRLNVGKKKDFKETKKAISLGKSSRNSEPIKEKEPTKSQSSSLDGTELFSRFTADIIKEDVFFTR
jgi:hypothetical protein